MGVFGVQEAKLCNHTPRGKYVRGVGSAAAIDWGKEGKGGVLGGGKIPNIFQF